MRIRLLIAAAMLALLTVVPAAAASASSNDFTFSSFEADYYLGRDASGNATLRTVEKLVARFPAQNQNHGIERAIPTTYQGADLELSNISVTDADGRSQRFTRSDDDGFAVLRIGDPDRWVHGTTTYVISYTERNVVHSFSDTRADEFYWDINGNGWSQPFASVSARVHLSDGISTALTGEMACYLGKLGETNTCEPTRDGDTVTAAAQELGPGETMTIAIGFEKGTFATPPLVRDSWQFTVLPWVVLALLVLLAGWIAYFRLFRWRDAPGRGIVIAQYQPLDNVHPALAAELLGKRTRALVAQIVSFAVNKILRIREFPKEAPGRRYELELLTDRLKPLRVEERGILTALFGKIKPGRTQRLDPEDHKLGDRLAPHRLDERNRVRSLPLRTKPKSKVPVAVWVATIAILAIAIGILIAAADSNAVSPLIIVAFVLSLVAWPLLSFLVIPPWTLTERGAEVRDHLLGLRDYIRLAEADRIRVLQAPDTAERVDVSDRSAVVKLHEKLLPYAMIFGLEREWITELSREYAVTEPPEWADGMSDFSGLGLFAGAIASTSFSTTPTPSSSGSWSSSGGGSSSGGSSGGGSSGGGGGGGGGGGW